MKYIDLGLPSGILWAEENEEGYYNLDDAIKKYGDSLPTKEQFEELKDHCKWEWNGSGYDVTGHNGNTIVLPAAGYIFYYRGGVYGVGSTGFYWSSSPNDSDDVWGLSFNSGFVKMDYDNREYGSSIRLVKSKNKDNIMKDKEFNIAEILKDAPEGTQLYSPICGTVILDSVKDDYIYTYTADKGATVTFFSDGKYIPCPDAECLLFPSKDNRDWDTFNVRQNFKKGDIVTRVYEDEYFLLLMDDTDWSSPHNRVKVICSVNLYNNTFYVSKPTDFWCNVSSFCTQGSHRLATDEEKAKLLDAIDKNGYVWDSEKLELCKKDEKPNYKKGDFVVDFGAGIGPQIVILNEDVDWSKPTEGIYISCIYGLKDNVFEGHCRQWGTVKDFEKTRFATEDERKKFIEVIFEHGYIWDSEKNELCKIEEKPNFKKGDFVTCVYDDEPFLLLMDDTDWSSPTNEVNYICFVDLYNGKFKVSKSLDYWCTVSTCCMHGGYRLATDEEKAKLLDAIDKNGYVWDSEKLELRKKDEKPKFKKGDFIVDLCGDNRTIMILEDDVDLYDPSGKVNVACSCDIDNVYRNLCLNKIWCTMSELSKRVRYATEDEILILLYIIDKHGYVWNKEKLELCEKEHEFKPFDRVLVRAEYDTQWFATLFSHIDENHPGYKYGCCDGGYWKYCIPYEGNEHLLGTANSPDEEGGEQ